MKLVRSAIVITAVSLFTLHSYGQKTISFPAFSAEAHRGGRGLMPENTIKAMINTLNIKGITTLEMDTHITKDGQVVVTHDDYLSPAFMLTPDGQDIPATDAKKYPVFGMNYAALKQFDLGTKYYDLFPTQQKVKTYIPLLADLIDSVQYDIKKNKRQQFFYNIETKCSPQGDGLTNPTPEVFVKSLMDVIEKKKISPFVVIQSFDKRTIQIIHEKYPKIKTSFLVANKKSYDENIADLGFKPFILSPVWQMVTAEMVTKAHADGVKIIPWTANKPEDIQNLKALDVDGIISDYPDVLVQAK
ncbi:glycerophosphodiester phosphodiesterase family protein [Pedobacter psychrotolerans]|uniref:glycerophosphodiester phosphodiesterase family protein n=1 Tax=Pedobacter psychrotolerans TaxID=1843235 RepID=UPI003F9C373E